MTTGESLAETGNLWVPGLQMHKIERSSTCLLMTGSHVSIVYFVVDTEESIKMPLDLEKLQPLLYRPVLIKTTIAKGYDFQNRYFAPRDDTNNKFACFAGYMKCVDPISGSIILCQINDKNQITKNILILGNNVSDISAIHDKNEEVTTRYCDLQVQRIKNIIEKDSNGKLESHPHFSRASRLAALALEPEDLSRRQKEIIEWLRHNRIPCDISEEQTTDIIVADSVRIRPPYEQDCDYVCPTNTVLRRLKAIIDSRSQTCSRKIEQEL